MQNKNKLYYTVLYRDHNNEINTVHNIIASSAAEAQDIFSTEYKYTQSTIETIIETIAGCNTYYLNDGKPVLF